MTIWINTLLLNMQMANIINIQKCTSISYLCLKGYMTQNINPNNIPPEYVYISISSADNGKKDKSAWMPQSKLHSLYSLSLPSATARYRVPNWRENNPPLLSPFPFHLPPLRRRLLLKNHTC